LLKSKGTDIYSSYGVMVIMRHAPNELRTKGPKKYSPKRDLISGLYLVNLG
jgi:hypothetical protein